MAGLSVFWQREWRRMMREGTVPVVIGLFLVIALLVPLTFFYLPQLWLVELLPSFFHYLQTQGEGAATVFLVTWAILGILVVPLWAMSSIAPERASRELEIPLGKAGAGGSLVWGKWLAAVSLLSIALVLSFAAFTLYSRTVFPYGLAWRPTLLALACVGLFFFFLLAMGFLWSSLLRRPGWSAIFSWLILAGLTILPEPFASFSPLRLLAYSHQAAFSRILGDSFWIVAGVTLALTILFLLLAAAITSRFHWGRRGSAVHSSAG